MTKLIYPHIYLFAYHHSSEQSNFEDLDQPKPTRFGDDGFYSKRRIDDSDTLLIACSVADKVNPSEKHCLEVIKDKLQTQKQELSFSANIGKTWVITGYLPRFSYEVSAKFRENIKKEIAEKIYTDFGFESFPKNIKPGQFMEGTVFEISTNPKHWDKLDAENNHVLIILYPDLKTMEKIANFYEDWRFLFYYRNKIVWAYSNAQQIKSLLKTNFSPVDKSENKILLLLPQAKLSESNLKELEEFLEESYRDLASYTENITSLELQKQTIKTNLYNFQQRLKAIENRAEEVANNSTKLDILNNFSKTVGYKYLAQVEQYYIEFSPGLKLRDKWIDTTRGIVEIRQVQLSEQKEEREQNFQRKFAIVGVGMGAASVIASTTANYIEPIREYPPVKKYVAHWTPKLADMVLTTALSIIVGVLFAFLTALIIWYKVRDREHR
ncbi:MAG: hypothetical protein F6K47_16670 [Symploca sp. SIO2E6]|nr:hypothetical protein [Symploca sp. SIO2E6]